MTSASVNPAGNRAFAVVGAIALAFRMAPYLVSGALTGIREYDDGVMFSGALTMLAGRSPYADFVYLHPPGSLLLFAPLAAMAGVLTDSGALALARILAILTGVANAVLIAFLLRKRGVVAALTGGALYALWPVVVNTERTILLEPILNLCLLVALCCISTRIAGRQWIAGVAMGVALSVKYLALVDVAILAIAIAGLLGFGALLRFLSAGVATTAALVLPFFLRAPGQMWEQTVRAQLARPSTGIPLGERLQTISLTQNLQGLDQVLPTAVWVGVMLALVAVAAVPVLSALVRRDASRLGGEALWGMLVLAHSAVLLLGSVYYYHYAVWLLAPLALTTGAAAGWVRALPWRRAVALGIILTTLIAGIGEWRRMPSASSSVLITQWAASHNCVWAYPQELVFANAASRNLRNGCVTDVDPFGTGLVLLLTQPSSTDDVTENAAWVERAWSQVELADAVMLTPSRDFWWFSPQQTTAFTNQFRLVRVADGLGLWDRVSPP